MSLSLTNRLDKLENEIRVMLMLQRTGCANVQPCMTVTTKQDGHIQGVECQIKSKGTRSETGQVQRCSAKTCNLQCQKPFPPKTSVAGDSPTRHKNGSQSCCCGNAAKFMEAQLLGGPICKCGLTPEKELELEKERRLQLESDVERMKLQIADMLQSKCMALNMTKQLKQRYEKMKGVHEDTATKLTNLQRENEFLSRNLEKERMEKIKTESSVQVTKDFDKASLRKMKQQAAKIRTLNDSVINLSRTVEDREFEKKRLEHEKDKIHEKLKKNKDMTKKLSETNAKLAKSVRQKHDSFLAVRDKAGQYEKELTVYKEEVRRSQLELERLKNEVDRQKNRGDTVTSAPSSRSKDDKPGDILGEKLKKTKEKERRASETIQLLSQRIRDLEHKDPKSAEKEIQRVRDELKALQQKYTEAFNKLKEYEEADKKKSEMIQNEMKKFADSLAVKEEAYLEEKAKMKQLIEELQAIIDQQRARIAELELTKEQQDVVIRTQIEQLNSKEEQIKLRERENDLVKEQCLDLDKQVDNLRTSIDHFEQIGVRSTHIDLRERINNLSDEVDSLKATLRNEEKKGNTKDQVIEDQYNQIQDLKTKLRDLTTTARESDLRVKSSKERLERMSRQLVSEKAATKKTLTQLTSIQKKKKMLEKDVENLEEAYQEMSSISVLDRLDKEQKIWDEQKKKLTEERDRAIDAAKMATKTLMETMDDFQGQIKSQQRLQKIVADIISTQSNPKIRCAKYKEAERLRQLQVAIPCKRAAPRCNLRSNLPPQSDEYYTAECSDSNTSGALGIFNFLGHYSSYSSITPPCVLPTTALQPTYPMPSISRPISPADCRCANTQTFTCRCIHTSGVRKCSCRKQQLR